MVFLTNADSVTAFIAAPAIFSMLFACFLFWRVYRIKLTAETVRAALPSAGATDAAEAGEHKDAAEAGERLIKIYNAVRKGADAFLFAEYRICLVFCVFFSIVILILVSHIGKGKPGTTANGFKWQAGGLAACAFMIGALCSIFSGYVGMKVAVYSNGRTCLSAIPDGADGWRGAFSTAMNAGGVMGFALCGLSLVILYIVCVVFAQQFDMGTEEEASNLFEAVSGFGLGGSAIAMFGRVGGGIFTKAADVGADLAGKVVQNIPEDDPRNPAVIADNVGDNVGDVAGMGADLFGSMAESSCAALVSGAVLYPNNWSAQMFPLVISAIGIMVCAVTHFFATDIWPVKAEKDVLRALKVQIAVSTIGVSGALYPVIIGFLPTEVPASLFTPKIHDLRTRAYFSIASGLWGGALIGFITEYFTSYDYEPTREVARSTETGAATNIIYGLALGFKSAILPIMILSVDIYVSFTLLGMYGVALCALGMLSTLACCLTIDVYGPICDNAGGIAEMSGLPPSVREKTDALDAAGNTTAAIGKGFAIGSAALVSLSLFGAFMNRVNGQDLCINILNPIAFACLVLGAMIPYWFSAMTMKSVGSAAMAMVKEVERQFKTIPGLLEGTPGHEDADYAACIKIATDASLKEMILPGGLVIFAPIFVGVLFGISGVCGLLAGAMSSGVQLAVSMSNTGGAWDNAKKFVEKGGLSIQVNGEPIVQKKGSDAHKAAVIGDTVGDPLKDTSGPAINIVMKLMAIISLVFVDFFMSIRGGHGGLGVRDATCTNNEMPM